MTEAERVSEIREWAADQRRRIGAKMPLSKWCTLSGPDGPVSHGNSETVTWLEAPLSFSLNDGGGLGELAEALPPSAEFSYSDRLVGGISVSDVVPEANFMKRSRWPTGPKSCLTPEEYGQELAGWKRTRETTLDWAGWAKGKVATGDTLVRLIALKESLNIQVRRDFERIARPVTALQRVLVACVAESEASSPTSACPSRVIDAASSLWLEVRSGTRPRFVRDIISDVETAMAGVELPDERIHAQVTGLNHFLDRYEAVWVDAARADAQRVDCERVLDHVLQGGTSKREDLAIFLRGNLLQDGSLVNQTHLLFMRVLLEPDEEGGVRPNGAFKGKAVIDLYREMARIEAIARPDVNPPLTAGAFDKRLQKILGEDYPKGENISKSERMTMFTKLACDLHGRYKSDGIDVDLVSEQA